LLIALVHVIAFVEDDSLFTFKTTLSKLESVATAAAAAAEGECEKLLTSGSRFVFQLYGSRCFQCFCADTKCSRFM
jgi:hypothetical protein